MKKYLFLLIIGLVSITLAACGGEDDKLVVGATNVPHAVILEEAASLLEDEGIELEVVTFTKYELINQALVNEELDANYFQHIPYFETEQAEKDYDIANAG